MKKGVSLGIIVICILMVGGTRVFAEELKEPTIAEIVGEESKPESWVLRKPILKTADISEVIYVPTEEVGKIKDIQKNYREIKTGVVEKDKFLTAPILANGTYALGEFKPEIIEKAAKQVNFYRTLAGVLPIPLMKESIDFTQHAAMGMAAIQKQTHYLDTNEKPADMLEEFWTTANQASRQSNIHSSRIEQSLNSHQDTFLVDWGVGNKVVGHRSVMLGLSGIDLGFGYAKANKEAVESGVMNYFTSTFTKSDYKGISTRYEDNTVVTWPSAGVFPYELYNIDNPYKDNYYKEKIPERYEKNMRWSVHFNEKGYKLTDDITVTLTNQTSGERTAITNDMNGGELTIVRPEPGYYGQGGYTTIVFRPNNNYTVEKNAVYKVEITGIKRDGESYTHVYETRFAGMNDTFEAEIIPVKEITFDAAVEQLEVEESAQIKATVLPKNATNKVLVWKSSDNDIATVDQTGLVKALKAGTVVIKAETEDGKVSKEQTFKVYNERININYADYDELQKIVGINNDMVNDLVTERNKSYFSSIDDLSRVESIDSKLLEKIKEQGIVYVPTKFSGVFPAKIANIFEDQAMGNNVARALGVSVYDKINEEDLLTVDSFGNNYLEPVNSFRGIEYLSNMTRMFVYTGVSDFSWSQYVPNLENLDLFGDIYQSVIEEGKEKKEVVDGTHLAELKKLKRLYLSELKIVDLSFINHLSEIEEFSVFRMSIDTMPNISLLENLTYVGISSSEFNDLTWMLELKQLEDLGLDLQYNNLTDITNLANLEHIGSLNLSNNNISDIRPLANLKEFWTLNLRNNQIEKVDGLEQLVSAGEVDLSRNRITDIAGLRNLEQVSTLNLSYNKLIDITPLENLMKASLLDLSNNQITDRSPLNGSGKSFYRLNLNNNPLK